jgi:hypothetical protein
MPLPRIADPLHAAMVSEYTRGVLPSSLAKKYQVSERTVYRVLARYDVPTRRRPTAPILAPHTGADRVAIDQADAYPQPDDVVDGLPMWSVTVTRTLTEVLHIPATDAEHVLAIVEADPTVTDITAMRLE